MVPIIFIPNFSFKVCNTAWSISICCEIFILIHFYTVVKNELQLRFNVNMVARELNVEWIRRGDVRRIDCKYGQWSGKRGLGGIVERRGQ